MTDSKNLVTKCPTTQLPCGFMGLNCHMCPDNPRNTGTFESGWQSCPRCAGYGKIEDTLMGRMDDCPVCDGKMIINIKTGRPPL